MTPTPSQTVGPFFHLGCTDPASIGCLVTAATKGERIRLTCRVFDGEGAAVPDAMIEIWQANAVGLYNHPEDTRALPLDPSFHGFGRLATDSSGTCEFETIHPGRVPADDGTLLSLAAQAPHINVSVFARGLLKHLATRIYFAGDAANAADPVLRLVPEERRGTLLAHADSSQANHSHASHSHASRADENHWRFDIHLCGGNETVFFDV